MPTRSRLIVAALLSLASFAASINLLFAGLVRMGAEFGIRPEILASVSSVYFLCFLAVSLLAGYLTDRLGARPVLVAGCGVTIVGGLFLAFAVSPASVVAGSVAMGMGGGVIESMCSALLTRLFPNKGRFALNLSQAGYCFGAVAGPFLMSWLLPRGVDWRWCFAPVAGFAGIDLLLFLTSTFPSTEATSAAGATQRTSLDTLKRWSVIQLCLAIFLYVLAESAISGFLNIYLFTYRHAPESLAIQSISAFWGVMLVGRVLTGLLPDSFPSGPLISVTFVVSGLCVALTLVTGSWPAALLCFMAASFVMAGTWPTIVAATANRHPSVANTVVGVTVATGSFGCIVSPLIVGRLFEWMDPVVVMSLPAIPLIAGGLLTMIPARLPQAAASSASS